MIFVAIILVVLIFGFLIFVHELGHFVAARRSGVEVYEFGFGFPPRVWGKKVGATIYSINALPLGGFVRMKGENADETGKGSFGAASFWQKTKILFAGVTMNALTAYVILVWLCLTGLPPVMAGQFSFGATSYARPKQIMAADVSTGSPAATAGLKRGNVLLTANGQKLATEQDLLNFTKSHAGQSVQFEVADSAKPKAPHHTISPTLRPPDSKSGFLGVTPFQTYQQKYSLPDALVTSAGLLVQLMWGTLAAFGGLIAGLFIHGKVSDQVAGPVGIVAILKNVIDLGAAYVLVFIASISVSLAVVNALPLPALDGGRWLLAAVQRVTRRQLSNGLEQWVHTIGFAALLLLMAVVTFFDIKRLG